MKREPIDWQSKTDEEFVKDAETQIWLSAFAGVHEEQEYVLADVHAALARQAEALQRENAELHLIVGDFIQAHIDGPGLLDCMDNGGNRYTSQFLADAISRARALLGGSDAGN